MSGDAWLMNLPSPESAMLGLARNPAIPVELLLRMLAEHPDHASVGLLRRRRLPEPVQAAMRRHADPRVRGALGFHRDVEPQHRAALLADADWRVRLRAFGRYGQRPVPDEALTQLLTDIDDGPADAPASRHELFTEFFYFRGFQVDHIRLAATHPRPGVRRAAAGSFSALDESTQNALLTDVAEEVRQVAAASVAYDRQIMRPDDLPELRGHTYFMVLQRTLSPELARQVAAGDDIPAIEFVAGNLSTPPDVVEALLTHADVDVRRAVAKRTDLTEEQLTRLIADPAVAVRTEVSAHPSLAEQRRAVVVIDVDSVSNGDFGPAPEYVRGSLDSRWSEEDALRWARSVNPLLRRKAAYGSRLPLDVVLDLANDADLGVRTILAFHHPQAPPELLLRCYLEYRGRGRAQLTELPQFPVAGLARYADDPDPTLRLLAPRDPDADPLLVERLVTDPEPAVRQAAAAGSRLPAARLVALLADPELAEYAAANSGLPVSEMRRILTPGSSSGTAGPGRPGS